jgi:hypothetical protein
VADTVSADAVGGTADGSWTGRRRRTVVVAYFVFLTALCAVVFLPSINAGFFEDDFGYFNVTMQPNWWRSSPAWDFAAQVLRPVTVLAIGLQRELFGYHPLPYHLVGLALLVVEGVLVHLIGRRLGLSLFGSLAAATVLMLHSTNGWSISWTASTSSFYGAILAMTTIWFLAEREPGRRRMIGACVALALALLAREVTMVVPFIVVAVRCLFLDGPLRARLRRSGREAVPLFAVLGLYLALRYGFAIYAQFVPEKQRLIPILNMTGTADTLPWLPLHFRDLFTLATSPARTIYRPGSLGFPGWVMATAVVIWALIIWQTVRETRAGRHLAAAGLAWFLIGIVPPMFLQSDMIYGNYTDLAAPGLALAVAAIAQHAFGRLSGAWRPLAAVGGIGVLAALPVAGGNYLVEQDPDFIARARIVEAQLRERYPDGPEPGSTVVIEDAHPDDNHWLSAGDNVRVLFDDPTLEVVFEVADPGD